MAYPTIGAEGSIASWGITSNFYVTMLSRVTSFDGTLNITGDTEDITALGATTQATLGKLKSASLSVRGYAAATPQLGNASLLTVAAGTFYNTHVYGYRINIETDVEDITALNVADDLTAGTPKWKRFRPKITRWSGEIDFGIDNALSSFDKTIPQDPNPGTPIKLTFTPSANFVLSGSGGANGAAVILNSNAITVRRGEVNKATVGFTGNGVLGSAGTASPFGVTDFGIPLWSVGSGTPVGPLVFQSNNTGPRSYSLYDSFWKRLSIDAKVNQPVLIEAEIQGSGAVTFA